MGGDIAGNPVEVLKGSIEEALGKLTGDVRVEAKGRRRKLAGSRAPDRRRVGPGSIR